MKQKGEKVDLAQQANDLTILLPAHNEAPAIGKVVSEIREFLPGCKILVVNNGSTNNTKEESEAYGVEVLEVSKLGKGNAVRVGLKFVNTPYVIIMDSDFTYPAHYLPILYHLLESGRSDVVLGSRAFNLRKSMTLLNFIGNNMLSLLASILYQKRVYDLCTGMWGFKKEVLDKFGLSSERFTLEADFFVNSMKNGCRIEQVPISYRERIGGTASKLRPVDGLRISWFLVKRRFKCPLVDLGILFGFVLILGFVWLVALYYVSHDYSLWVLLKKISGNKI